MEGATVLTPLTNQGQFGKKEQTLSLCLHAEFYLARCILSQICLTFTIWGLVYPSQVIDHSQIYHMSRPSAVVKVDRRIRWHYTTTILRLRIGARLTRYRNRKFHNFACTISRHADGISRYSVLPSAGPLLPLALSMCLRARFRPDPFTLSPVRGKKPQILPQFLLWHSVVIPPSGIDTKLNMGSQLQALCLTISEVFLSSSAFWSKSFSQTLPFHEHDRLTN